MERKPVLSSFLTDDKGSPTGGTTTGQGFAITWQNGVQERTGAYLEEVIEACIARLNFFQSSKFNCRENALAITKLEEALLWLGERTRRREARSVEGSYEV